MANLINNNIQAKAKTSTHKKMESTIPPVSNNIMQNVSHFVAPKPVNKSITMPVTADFGTLLGALSENVVTHHLRAIYLFLRCKNEELEFRNTTKIEEEFLSRIAQDVYVLLSQKLKGFCRHYSKQIINITRNKNLMLACVFKEEENTLIQGKMENKRFLIYKKLYNASYNIPPELPSLELASDSETISRSSSMDSLSSQRSSLLENQNKSLNVEPDSTESSLLEKQNKSLNVEPDSTESSLLEKQNKSLNVGSDSTDGIDENRTKRSIMKPATKKAIKKHQIYIDKVCPDYIMGTLEKMVNFLGDGAQAYVMILVSSAEEKTFVDNIVNFSRSVKIKEAFEDEPRKLLEKVKLLMDTNMNFKLKTERCKGVSNRIKFTKIPLFTNPTQQNNKPGPPESSKQTAPSSSLKASSQRPLPTEKEGKISEGESACTEPPSSSQPTAPSSSLKSSSQRSPSSSEPTATAPSSSLKSSSQRPPSSSEPTAPSSSLKPSSKRPPSTSEPTAPSSSLKSSSKRPPPSSEPTAPSSSLKSSSKRPQSSSEPTAPSSSLKSGSKRSLPMEKGEKITEGKSDCTNVTDDIPAKKKPMTGSKRPSTIRYKTNLDKVSPNFIISSLKRMVAFLSDDSQTRHFISVSCSEEHKFVNNIIRLCNSPKFLDAFEDEPRKILEQVAALIDTKKTFKVIKSRGQFINFQKVRAHEVSFQKMLEDSTQVNGKPRHRSGNVCATNIPQPNPTPPRKRPHDGVNGQLIQALSVPVKSDLALKMMMGMGWTGGALGARGEGITEPIMPSLNTNSGAGLGHSKIRKVAHKVPIIEGLEEMPRRRTALEFRLLFLTHLLEFLTSTEENQTIDYKLIINKKETAYVQNIIYSFNSRARLKMQDGAWNLVQKVVKEFEKESSLMVSACISVDRRNITFTKLHDTPRRIHTQLEMDKIVVSLKNYDAEDFIHKHGPLFYTESLMEQITFRVRCLLLLLQFVRNKSLKIVINFEREVSPRQEQYICTGVDQLNKKRKTFGEDSLDRALSGQIAKCMEKYNMTIHLDRARKSFTVTKDYINYVPPDLTEDDTNNSNEKSKNGGAECDSGVLNEKDNNITKDSNKICETDANKRKVNDVTKKNIGFVPKTNEKNNLKNQNNKVATNNDNPLQSLKNNTYLNKNRDQNHKSKNRDQNHKSITEVTEVPMDVDNQNELGTLDSMIDYDDMSGESDFSGCTANLDYDESDDSNDIAMLY